MLIRESPFLIALVENPPVHPLNCILKPQNKKGTGTATILTTVKMLQLYKNSTTEAQITALINLWIRFMESNVEHSRLIEDKELDITE